MAMVKGEYDERFKEVASLLQTFLDTGEELGASIAVNLDGKNVVNIWGGHADAERTKPWEEDTICCVFSTTKTVSALAVLKLVDMGLIDLDEKVAKYWPEFAANGKENIEVRHILSHTAALPGWRKKVTLEDVGDVGKVAALLAEDAPWWEPGTASGYQSLSLGPLVGELVRRVSGKSLKAFVAEDIAGPLNADFQLGVLDKDLARVSPVIPPPNAAPPPSEPLSHAAKVSTNPPMYAAFANSKTFRESEWGAGNGHSNAAAMARIMSVVSSNGQADEKPFLSPQTISHIFREQAFGKDLVLGIPVRWGIGYALPAKNTFLDWLPVDSKLCVWGGFGGSHVIMDLDRRMTIAYVMNKMDAVGMGSERGKAYVKAVYKVERD